ncbi:MAG: amino acid adenylation domain-containing protein [Methylobacter sp.]|nr:amino acid adenylation domain-containing protein [Methylobacter sp.]
MESLKQSSEPVTEPFLERVGLTPEMIESMEQRLDYWTGRLSDAPILELPTDRPRPAIPSYRGESQQFSLSSDLTKGLKALSRDESVTLFMTLVAAFYVLLHRYSGQDDIVIGTPSAGRSRQEPQSLSGFFVNTLALRADLSGNPGFRELLAQVREVTVGAYANQDIPVEKLVDALHPQRDPTRNALFQVMFVLQNTPKLPQLSAGTTQFDLTLELSETPHGLAARMEYAADLFEAATIDRLIGHFQTLLEGIVADPDAHLSELPLLTEPERRQLLIEWNDTGTWFPRDKCIHELFEAQVAATPQAVALVCEHKQLTYAELNTQANQLAHLLGELGVKPDALVAICAERSLNMVVGVLAILKAGGAYVPLDPTHPKERLAFMIEDSAPVALLTQHRLDGLFTGMAKALPVIYLDAELPPWTNRPDTNPVSHEEGLAPNHLAYMIYTSGSTGKPKGVMIEHRSVCNLIADLKNRYNICAEDRILQFVAIGFDVSIQEIFGALLSGAALVLRNDDWIAGAKTFWALCEKNNVSMITLPTLFWQQLAQDEQAVIPPVIRQIIFGGEAVSNKVLAAWFERKSYRPKLFNEYGPTEATVKATIHEPLADSLSWQSIGRPISNTRIYILDTNNQPVPIGLTGELYIGGVGVARGYLNRLELTEEHFVADPYTAQAGARMYKTGDLARWRADGTIEFLGRNDFQVKIRGFRIELGDIEAKLAAHPAVREVAVLADDDGDGAKRLVAYLVLKHNFTSGVSELRDFLKEKIPEFMVPSVFMFLDTLPITLNGKLDREALPKPDISRQAVNHDFVAPQSPVEKQLAGIWGEILRMNDVGIHDNFFELGGQSLLATQMIIRVEEQLSVDIPLTRLFEMPTIAALAKLIENTEAIALNHANRIIPQRRSAYKVNT